MIFANGLIVLEDCILENGSVAISGDRITAVSAEKIDGSPVFDLQGQCLIPGFVDIHCHAGGNRWFFDDPAYAARSHLEAGTTALLCSLWRNAGFYSFEKSIEKIAAATAAPDNVIRGIHMEGPYVDPALGSDGGQAYPIHEAEYQTLIRLADGLIRVWTLRSLPGWCTCVCPLCPGAKHRPRCLLFQGRSGDAKDLFALWPAYRQPYFLRHRNHLRPRFRGTVEPGSDFFVLGEETMTAELIADSLGAHVRTFLLDFVYKLKGADHIALVSDCCAGGRNTRFGCEHHRRGAVWQPADDGHRFSQHAPGDGGQSGRSMQDGQHNARPDHGPGRLRFDQTGKTRGPARTG